jgi:multiple antibiotic resistance protein
MGVMMEDLLRSSVALFVVVDPLGNIPILIELTKHLEKKEREKVFDKAILVGSLLLLLFAFAGHQILILFGVSLHSFMIAGGLLFFILALQILVSGGERLLLRTGEVGVFPVGFPLLAGPGAITNTMLSINSYGQVVGTLSVLIVMLLSWVILRRLDPLYHILGRSGSDVVARVMAVFLTAIAVEYIVTGLRGYVS